MARFSRVHVWTAIESAGLVPMFHHGDGPTARRIVEALHAGGAGLIEYTNRGDGAHLIFADLVAHFTQSQPELILGAGSILDAATAALYINIGAKFIVGSVLNAEVASLCNRRMVAYCPGCATPTELSLAEELGAEICKLFPARELGGPAFVRAVLGPCPWLKIMATGGVKANWHDLQAWFGAGVTAVGLGSNLVRREWVSAGDWDALTGLTRQCLSWVEQARQELISSAQ
jgi:2-dehydro-3-deoxyphosphogluconate aldolase/(4S)-4-hydroxy-2-oxoglutarate aldolase